MKKSLTRALALGLFALAACAEARPPVKSADPALWVVRDADTTIYLFGTVHVLKPDLPWFDDEVKAAFDRSDELVLEMVEPAPAEMAQVVAKLAYSPNGPTITEQLPPEAREKYKAAMDREGIDWRPIERFDPWMAAVSLSVAPLKRAGYTTEAGSEDVLTRAARTQRKPVVGLETAEQQLGYFDALAPRLQVTFLTSTVEELGDLPVQFDTLIAGWSRGDIRAIAREMNSSLDKTPELADALLYQRNRNWARWIAHRLDRPGTAFVAVGAGHLAGKGSVQDELAALRVKVARVRKRDPVAQ